MQKQAKVDRVFRSGPVLYLIRACAASLLLIIIALVQIYRAQALQQSPWKGGGFGMFASIDRPSSRHLRCYLLTSEGEIPAAIARAATPLLLRAQVVPDRKHLLHLAANLLADANWLQEQIERKTPPPDGDAAAGPITQQAEVLGLRVEVWSPWFNSKSRRLTILKLAEATRYRN